MGVSASFVLTAANGGGPVFVHGEEVERVGRDGDAGRRLERRLRHPVRP